MGNKHIVFLGLFGQKNLGNECTLQTMIQQARDYFPDAEFRCVCTDPRDVVESHNIQAFDIYADSVNAEPKSKNNLLNYCCKIVNRMYRETRHTLKALRMLSGSDFLVVTGGGILNDNDNIMRFKGYPYVILKWALMAWLCRCKILFVSVGAGPIYHPLSKVFIKRALSLSDYRSYRDHYSKDCIQGVGLNNEADKVYPDLAFSLPKKMFSESCGTNKTKTTIGVGLVDYYGQGSLRQRKNEEFYREYIYNMATFITRLIENNYAVRLLIGDIEYDSPVRDDVLGLLVERGCQISNKVISSESIESVEKLISQLAETDIVVSPRYHNIILATMLNIPVISLSYNQKFEALMADLGLEKYCQPLDQLNVDKLIAQIEEIQNDGKQIKKKIDVKVESYRIALDEQYKRIFQIQS